MTTVRLLVVSESISTSSTVGLTGGGLRIATLGVAEGEPDGARPRDRAHTMRRRRRYTLRRLRVGRQSIRERGAFPAFCSRREQPNPVVACSDFRDLLLNSHTCRPKLPLRAPPLAPRADGHVMLHALPVLVRKPCSASSKTAGGSQDRVTDVLTSLHSNMVRKSLRTCRSWCSPRQ